MKIYDNKYEKRKIENFGATLQKLRVSRRISKAAMARELGISASAYAWYESGQREPSLKNLVHLANFFKVSVDYILDFKRDEFAATKAFWTSLNYELEETPTEQIILTLPFIEKNKEPEFNNGIISVNVNENRYITFKSKKDLVNFTNIIQEQLDICILQKKEEICREETLKIYEKSKS